MTKIKLSEVNNIFNKMKAPRYSWDATAIKVVDYYEFSIERADGYEIHKLDYKGKEIYYACDGSGDYTYNKEFIQEL